MLRDFSVVATAMGADLNKIKRAGPAGIVSLFVGVFFSFFLGVTIALVMGYSDPVSLATIGAGACTYIVGPITGSALGAGISGGAMDRITPQLLVARPLNTVRFLRY